MATHASPHAQPLHAAQVTAAPAAGGRRWSWPSLAPWIGAGALIFAGTLVFWLFDSLPFQDLPAHAGIIALRHRFGSSPFEQHYFVVAPHLGPYSLFRFLGDLFVVPLGPVGAVRAIATLPMLATPLALVWARRRLHGDTSPTAAYFGVALSFGFMTILGFASYLLGVAVMLVGLTLWLELLLAVDRGDPNAPRREIAVACFAPLVLVAHGHAFLLFLATAAASAIATGRRAARLLRLRALAPAVAIAAWATWVDRAVPAGSVAAPNPAMQPHFQGAYDKFSLLITPTLLSRTGVDACIGVLLWVVLGASILATARASGRDGAASLLSPASIRGAASPVHARGLLACLGLLGATFLVLPHSIGWFGFVDGRLVPVALLVAVMAVRRESLGRVLGIAYDRFGPIAAAAMVGVALWTSHAFQAEARGWREVLAAVPSETRLLNLPLEPNSDVFSAHPFIHYDKLALAERPLVVSDVWFHQGTALYPTAENPALRLPSSYSESDLKSIDWPAYRLEDWDYVLIRTTPSAARPDVPESLALAAHRGGWWLFRTTR